MEVFGFICMVLILLALSFGWLVMLIFDGAFGGKREIPIIVMICSFLAISYFWVAAIGMSPFSVIVN